MDDDPVLRSLGEDLARDDPRLAALLDGRTPAPRRGHRSLLALALLVPLATVALLLPPTVAVGVFAIALAVAAPLAVCWLCAGGPSGPERD
jgi:hypothetical protein